MFYLFGAPCCVIIVLASAALCWQRGTMRFFCCWAPLCVLLIGPGRRFRRPRDIFVFSFARQTFVFAGPRLGRGGRGRDPLLVLFIRGTLLCYYFFGERRPLLTSRTHAFLFAFRQPFVFCSSARAEPLGDGSTHMFSHVLGQPLRRRCDSPLLARRSPSGRLGALWGYHAVSVFLWSGRGPPFVFYCRRPARARFPLLEPLCPQCSQPLVLPARTFEHRSTVALHWPVHVFFFTRLCSCTCICWRMRILKFYTGHCVYVNTPAHASVVGVCGEGPFLQPDVCTC